MTNDSRKGELFVINSSNFFFRAATAALIRLSIRAD